MVRRMDKQCEVLIWCRKCSEPQLMNYCKPEHVGTKEYGKMLKRIQILEVGRVPAKEARNWKIEGKQRRITGKEYRKLLNEFELKDFLAQKEAMEPCQREKCCKTEVYCQRK